MQAGSESAIGVRVEPFFFPFWLGSRASNPCQGALGKTPGPLLPLQKGSGAEDLSSAPEVLKRGQVLALATLLHKSKLKASNIIYIYIYISPLFDFLWGRSIMLAAI